MEFDKLSSKYQGSVARDYDAKRRGSKWAAELKAAKELIRRVPSGSKALDVPVGTGRLIPVLASCSLFVTGLDVSSDMLAEAEESSARAGARAQLVQGDIRKLPFVDNSFELVTCVRFLNWIDMQGVAGVMGELSRVSSDKLLVGVRYLSPLNAWKPSARDLMPTAVRLAGLPSSPLKRWGMRIHRKHGVEKIFRRLQLTILEKRLIERRWDSTDYVFYMLQKQ